MGRFQTNELTPGHIRLIEEVLGRNDKALILIGCTANEATSNNPLDYEQRAHMIAGIFPDVGIAPVFDHPSDVSWSNQVDSLIGSMYPLHDNVKLYGGRDSFAKHYHGHNKTVSLEFDLKTSATASRLMIRDSSSKGPEFREGVIHALTNLRPRVIPVVDICVYDKPCVADSFKEQDEGYVRILLGRKTTDPVDKWRFPGGFVDLNDESYEQTVRRETMEETNLSVAQVQCIGSTEVDDWRYAGVPDQKIMSALYIAKYTHGKETAGDDLDDVHWFDADSLTLEDFVDQHVPLAEKYLGHFGVF